MKNCENCNIEHTGKYGSGRFCSQKCSRSHSTKSKREEINKKLSQAFKKNLEKNVKMGFINPAKREKRECPICGEGFEVRVLSKKITCSKSCASKIAWKEGKYKKVDWSGVNLNSYSTGKNYVGGGSTKWINYKDIKVQGSYEYRACEILDEMLERGEILGWEYSITRVKYKYKGKERTYIIDFTVYNLDKSVRHIEVKGWIDDIDRAKWETARNLGMDLTVWMCDDLFGKKN